VSMEVVVGCIGKEKLDGKLEDSFQESVRAPTDFLSFLNTSRTQPNRFFASPDSLLLPVDLGTNSASNEALRHMKVNGSSSSTAWPYLMDFAILHSQHTILSRVMSSQTPKQCQPPLLLRNHRLSTSHRSSSEANTPFHYTLPRRL
jgi:hypothetical protein